MLQWIVSREEHQLSLLQFLKKRLPYPTSGKQIKAAVEKNAAQVNGSLEGFASRKLRVGDTVVFCECVEKKERIVFDQERVLYQDADYLVYNKPSGILSEKEGLLTLLQSAIGPLYLVHRLDKGTSGAIVFARSKEAYRHLSFQFRQREVAKEYWAIVQGSPTREAGTIAFSLRKKGHFSGQTILGKGNGKEAITHWQLEKRGEGASHLRCFPKTGRTHQIRVHLAEWGHPILGDRQYNRVPNTLFVPARPLLHAYRLCFTTGEKKVAVNAPLPDDFLQAMQKLSL